MENHFVDLKRRRALESHKAINDLIELIEDSKDLGDPEVQESIKSKKEKLRTLCRKLPVLMRDNGFITTFAFLKGKGTSSIEENIFEQSMKWITFVFSIPRESDNAFTYIINEVSQKEYVMISREAIKYFVWLKRHAEMEVKRDIVKISCTENDEEEFEK